MSREQRARDRVLTAEQERAITTILLAALSARSCTSAELCTLAQLAPSSNAWRLLRAKLESREMIRWVDQTMSNVGRWELGAAAVRKGAA